MLEIKINTDPVQITPMIKIIKQLCFILGDLSVEADIIAYV